MSADIGNRLNGKETGGEEKIWGLCEILLHVKVDRGQLLGGLQLADFGRVPPPSTSQPLCAVTE